MSFCYKESKWFDWSRVAGFVKLLLTVVSRRRDTMHLVASVRPSVCVSRKRGQSEPPALSYKSTKSPDYQNYHYMNRPLNLFKVVHHSCCSQIVKSPVLLDLSDSDGSSFTFEYELLVCWMAKFDTCKSRFALTTTLNMLRLER